MERSQYQNGLNIISVVTYTPLGEGHNHVDGLSSRTPCPRTVEMYWWVGSSAARRSRRRRINASSAWSETPAACSSPHTTETRSGRLTTCPWLSYNIHSILNCWAESDGTSCCWFTQTRRDFWSTINRPACAAPSSRGMVASEVRKRNCCASATEIISPSCNTTGAVSGTPL